MDIFKNFNNLWHNYYSLNNFLKNLRNLYNFLHSTIDWYLFLLVSINNLYFSFDVINGISILLVSINSNGILSDSGYLLHLDICGENLNDLLNLDWNFLYYLLDDCNWNKPINKFFNNLCNLH